MKFKGSICETQFLFNCLLLALLWTTTQSGFAQTPAPPLNFGNNFFVTGDYIVAGANGITTNFTTISGVAYAVGTITVPDSNPGITGTKQVPPGAQIVAALLYWQTAEKVGVAPGSNGSGQNGFFRPLLYSKSGGPAAPGYAISGTNISGSNTVSWSSGGCNSGSTGKVLRTYRADVAGAFPVDASGNPIANTSFEVRLPSAGNATPLTLGATLVVIYRIPAGAGGPSIPLNSIVIYDGDYSQSVSQLTMTQPLQGFYDAAHNPVSRLTHIVGSGQSNKFQTVYLSSGTNSFVKLPLLYGNKLPAFPGWYGTWDNPTWTFNSASPITEDASFATTQVVPSSSNQGCVSWGAVIVSTTVKNSDNDGILDSWKTNQGYCDASINPSCNKGDPGWVDLTGALPGEKDIFLQYDYMCSNVQGPASLPNSCVASANDYSFDPRLAIDPADGKNAVEKVVAAFDNHTGSPEPFVLHAIPGNAIAENQSTCAATDIDPVTKNLTCPFPNEPGTVGFREGLAYIKNQNMNSATGLLCTPGTMGCGSVPVFQHGKKDSYHYALFSHGVGVPTWFMSDPTTLTSVKQAGTTVTFTTPSPHGIAHIPGDSCQLGRVTVAYAITNPSLEGTFCVQSLTTAPPYTFTIKVGGSSTNFTYTAKTDPNLAIANGQVTSMSGFSDVGGQNSVISLGYGNWGPPAFDGNKWQVKAGTFMHELGHTLGLTHGGTFYKNLGSNDYSPTYEVNCKPNVQSIMSYVFQVDLLEKPNQLDSLGQPLMVVDFSEGALPTLDERVPKAAGTFSNAAYAKTAWYQLTSFAGGTNVGSHCDGTPLLSTDKPTSYTTDFLNNFFWTSTTTTGNDINFDGSSSTVMNGHDEWDGTVLTGVAPSPGVDLQQVSAVGTISAIGLGGEAGALHPAGGGGALHPAGGGGALHPAGGGGVLHPAGGGGLTAEITHEAANSYARPPRDLIVVQEEASPRFIDLSWFAPTFGQIVNYNIYRADGAGAFTKIDTVPGAQTTYQDKNVICTSRGHSYRVAAVINDDNGNALESSPSNTAPVTGEPLLTGCYVVPSFAPAVSTGVQAESVNVAWTLQDDFYATPPAAWGTASADVPVTNNNLAANTLYAIGPTSTDQCAHVTRGRTLLLSKGAAQIAGDVFSNDGDVFTFRWNSTDNFCAGSYQFELDLDSGQKLTSSAVQLDIDINDTNSTPHVTTVALPTAVLGKAYTDALTEDGGTAPFTWTVTGLPTGISQQPAGSANLSGATCVAAGSFLVNATVTDSATPNNSGSQGFTLQINKANTTTTVSSDANSSVFQQMVTFTVSVVPQYGCTPTETVTLFDGVTQLASPKSLTGGTATFTVSTLSVGVHSMIVSYSGDTNFNSSNSGAFSQVVNAANTQVGFNSVSPSPASVGQPVTVSYTLSVVAPGTGSPIAPSGDITVNASDGSSCVAPAALGAGMCTLSPVPSGSGNVTFTITYSGDGNFLTSGDNGNYDVQ